MKAMLLYKYGPPDVFEWQDVPVPQLKDNEILIKAFGSSVNPVDCVLRQGRLRAIFRLDLPAILGVDVSGIVEKTGSKVTGFSVGDRVYAFLGLNHNGAYAEYVAIPEAYAAIVPDNLKITEAGVVPGVGLTAYQAFTQAAPLVAGMKVLINGAGGGVGNFAVQIAKAMGAHVTGVCSESKALMVKNMGADTVINYNRENIFHSEKKFDVLLNCVRGSDIGKWKSLLTRNGKQVVIAANPTQMPMIGLTNIFSTRQSILFNVKPDGRSLQQLSQVISLGKVKPVITKTFHLKELAHAHEFCEKGSIAGKIAISITELTVGSK